MDEKMRAKEFVQEGKEKLDKATEKALPNANSFPELDNSSPYHSYRFGIALAGMPDYPMPLDGPTQQKLVTIGYTEADEEIIKATGKHLGFRGIVLTSKKSQELSDTNTVSPVAQWMKKS
ncbi:MAG: hypothetical protein EBV10_11485 [Synechococcaceae bacterium WB6_1A_059]|nr:hypothetical protein [Synechococcaceae bacterium WB6_1A_059]